MIDSLFFYFIGNCFSYKANITPWARSGAESEVIADAISPRKRVC